MDYIPQLPPDNVDAQSIGNYPYPVEQQPVTYQQPGDIPSRLNAQLSMVNIADGLDKSVLATIGQRVVDDFEADKNSRAVWEREQAEIAKLADMPIEAKYWAGKLVSNVKYPMILNAAIHYASRAYPEIVKGRDVVKCAVVGRDIDGSKAAKAGRVGAHMSYQLLEEMNWESELDQLLFTYSITGSEFKKTYYCPIKERNVSEIVFSRDLVVDYWCRDINQAARITHVIELSPNDIYERLASGIFRKDLTIEYFGQPEQPEGAEIANDDKDAPHIFLEQHRLWDLDGDGYAEPYIVTAHKQTSTVVRICARYDIEGITFNDDGSIRRIEPVQYFTHFRFMPAIDGGFYGMGFGKLLFGLNNAVNATLNQLIDAGTAANRMSGFLGRGVQIGRTQSGTDGFALGAGEWKSVPSTGDDLRKNIVPMPSKEPSTVLFQLMQFLIETGKEIASISDILSGESPGANVPAASTLALIEQGMKVFSGTFKRLYRSLKDEFGKIARLNRMYLSEESYLNVLDDQPAILQSDYSDETLDIIPVADPNNISDMGRAMKMQALMQLQGQGFDDNKIRVRFLESLNIENAEELIPKEPPPIDPKIQAEIDKLVADTELSKANAEKVKSDMVATGVGAQYSAMQAAGVIAMTPATAPIADSLLLSAGFIDKNNPPIVPQGMAQQQIPAMPTNTSPMFPDRATPIQPEQPIQQTISMDTAIQGMGRGIETQENDGVMN